METFQEYIHRTDGFMYDSLADALLVTAEGLKSKVNDDGSMKPFYGSTVVFFLESGQRRAVEAIIRQLYVEFAGILAQTLPAESLHITLHDLVNGSDRDAVSQRISETEEKARLVAEALAQGNDTIRLRGKTVFSMVNTSVVMGLEPCTDSDWAFLTKAYEDFENIVPLPYPLTLHITLAYYQPGQIGRETVQKLARFFKNLREESEALRFNLPPSALRYCTFSNMAEYLSREKS